MNRYCTVAEGLVDVYKEAGARYTAVLPVYGDSFRIACRLCPLRKSVSFLSQNPSNVQSFPVLQLAGFVPQVPLSFFFFSHVLPLYYCPFTCGDSKSKHFFFCIFLIYGHPLSVALIGYFLHMKNPTSIIPFCVSVGHAVR